MVRAILDGRKTQTRRVIKPQFNGWLEDFEDGYWRNCWRVDRGYGQHEIDTCIIKCPYIIGQKLWVRETLKGYDRRSWPTMIYYRASTPDVWPHIRWNPSIHMPRVASRIILEVTAVRVERVQEVTDRDAIAEGCLLPKGYEDLAASFFKQPYRQVFIDLWDSINAKRGYSWESNPWVWVIEFRVI